MKSANYLKENIILKNNNIQNKILIFYYTLFLATLTTIAYITVKYEYLYIHSSQVNSMIVILGFMIPILIWFFYFANRKIDLIGLSLFIMFIFLGAYSLLDFMGLDSNAFFQNTVINNFDIYKSNIVTVIGVNFFFLGAIYSNNYSEKIKNLNLKLILNNTTNFSNVGIILFTVGILFFLYGFNSDVFFKGTYNNFGNETKIDLIWQTLMPVSGFILMLSKKRTYRYIGFSIIIFIALYYLLIGNRGYSISLLLTFIWIYSLKIKQIKIVKFIIISMFLLILISTFYQMKESTVEEKLNINSYEVDSSFLISILEEGSTTSRSILYTTKSIPLERDFELGKSYLWALSTILPNVFGSNNHPSVSYTNPSEWLGFKYDQYQMNKGSGFGFSIIAEAYYNFGFLGVMVIMYILGYVLNKLQIKVIETNNVILIVIACIITHNFFWSIRNIAQSVARPIAWEVFTLILGVIIYKIIFNNKKNTLYYKK